MANISENQKIKKNKPPYLSLNKFSNLIKLVSTKSFTEISVSELHGRGFTGTDANVAIGALKFLGIINDIGKTTDKMRKLHLTGESREKELAQIVKDSYNKLFELTPEPYNQSVDDIYNDLLSSYDISGRLARTAVPVFVWLCEEAGLKERATKIRSVQKIKKNITTQHKSEKKKNIDSGNVELEVDHALNINKSLPIPFSCGVTLMLPIDERIGASTLSEEYRTMVEAINKYVVKFLGHHKHGEIDSKGNINKDN